MFENIKLLISDQFPTAERNLLQYFIDLCILLPVTQIDINSSVPSTYDALSALVDYDQPSGSNQRCISRARV